MTDEQIKRMVERFLNWPLPEDFHPDNGISCQRPNYAPEVAWQPVGTNLLTYTQAEAMVRYMVSEEAPPVDLTDNWMNPPARESILHRGPTYPRYLIERKRRLDHVPFEEWGLWKLFDNPSERDTELEALRVGHPVWQLRARDELHAPLAYN